MGKKSFHFDLGNSTDGPLGMCARVTADTEEEALNLLKAALPDEVSVPLLCEDGIEYVNVYLNEAAITVGDIDDEEDEEDDDEGEEPTDVVDVVPVAGPIVFLNKYTCYACGHEWEDEHEAEPDDDCPKCEARHCTPHSSEPAK